MLHKEPNKYRSLLQGTSPTLGAECGENVNTLASLIFRITADAFMQMLATAHLIIRMELCHVSRLHLHTVAYFNLFKA
jgi:hypothetical protein